ncbi:universal stress protein [Aliamphritea spongicola]|uniref:universal stress protein n=1 Tax=Aliamphritea spongicola TaxID=707589 RepID=UPI00196A7813|nr:universal stress protein [Aliamphritea spongicola]MBN3560909.1 universal stress protein [Aliamphritea spongicola]
MLQTINRILYASDLGQGSRPAFRYAVNEAIKHNAEIIFLHAVEPISELTEDIIEDYLPEKLSKKHSEQIMQSRKQRITERIESFVQSELEAGVSLPKPAIIKVSIGQPHKIILDKAKTMAADMIVMGDRESNSISRIFLGSTAQKVIHQSQVPVLIVPLRKEK